MKQRLLAIIIAATFVLLSACGGATTARVATPTATALPVQHYTAPLTELNKSGITGKVDLKLQGATLLVITNASGLVTKQDHIEGIRGDAGTRASCPTAAQAGADGILTTAEGAAAFGNVALPLDTLTSTSGNVTHTQTLTLTSDQKAKITPLDEKVIVLFGANIKGAYDGQAPAACGAISLAST
jgi:hypothetical protein